LVSEAKDSLHTTLTYTFQINRDVFFYKGQDLDGSTPIQTISRRCGLEVGSEQYHRSIKTTNKETKDRIPQINVKVILENVFNTDMVVVT
jgi:hypothetical protein